MFKLIISGKSRAAPLAGVDLAQRVGVALAVKVHAVFVADGVELVRVEKLGERLVRETKSK